MLKFTEKCFYIVLLVILLILAIFVPIIVVKVGKTPMYVYINADKNVERTPLFDGKVKKHLEEYIDNYYKLDELYEYLDDFVQYRKILFSKKIHDENGIFEIIMKKTSSCNTAKSKVLIVAGLVARDWGSVLTTIELLNKFFLDVKKTNKLLNSFEFHFLPLMNPDRYKFSMSLPIYQNWKYSYQEGHDILYSYDKNGNSPNEVDFFKNYFKKKKNSIVAAFFLFSPRAIDYKKRFTIPTVFVSKDTCKKKVIATLEKVIAAYDSRLKWKNISEERWRGRIDQWVLKQMEKPILVVNFVANFIPGRPETLKGRIKELGADAHFIVTTVLNAFKLMICN